MSKKPFVLAALSVVIAIAASPMCVAADARVAKALKALDVPYEVDDQQDYKAVYSLEGDRSQVVWITSDTSTFGTMELRDVWSPAFIAKGSMPAGLANRLLQENAKMVLGAWQVQQGEGESIVVFSSPVSVTADAKTLGDVIEAVIAVADEMEKELSERDDF